MAGSNTTGKDKKSRVLQEFDKNSVFIPAGDIALCLYPFGVVSMEKAQSQQRENYF